ncbi:MAG TPA: STAS domain-containing protein [Casimicrobiaceae bacterium]|nr:STAS domain-containing protein [Casimicrobiaceae bacterium]
MMPSLAGGDRAAGAFRMTERGWRFDGALTLDNAAQVFEASKAAALPASGAIDFSGMTHADSSALAVAIALKRRATIEGSALSIEGLPQSLRTLAIVYGVENLID